MKVISITLGIFLLCGPFLEAAAVPDEQATPLRVPPMEHVVYPKDRPEWLNDPPTMESLSETLVVHSGICRTAQEADEMLEVMIRGAAEARMERIQSQSDPSPWLLKIQIPDTWKPSKLVVRRYDGEVVRGGETCFESAAKIKFDESQDRLFHSLLAEQQVKKRLIVLGACAGSGLASLLIGSLVLQRVASRKRLS